MTFVIEQMGISVLFWEGFLSVCSPVMHTIVSVMIDIDILLLRQYPGFFGVGKVTVV